MHGERFDGEPLERQQRARARRTSFDDAAPEGGGLVLAPLLPE
jgi:hypothetical protein